MKDIETYTDDLVTALKNSEAYHQYIFFKEEIDKNPELKIRLNEFRIKNYRLQNSEETSDLYEITDEVTREYTQLKEEPLISGFLEYELRLCKSIQQIYDRLVGAVDLGISDFMDEI